MGEGFTLWSLSPIAWEGREPLRDWIYLSVSAFQILPFHRFLNSRRPVTPIGLTFGHDLYPDIRFLGAKEGHQPPYGVSTWAQGAPLPRGPLGYHLTLIFLPKNHKYSKNNLRLFLSRLDSVSYWVSAKHKTCNKQELALGTGSIC